MQHARPLSSPKVLLIVTMSLDYHYIQWISQFSYLAFQKHLKSLTIIFLKLTILFWVSNSYYPQHPLWALFSCDYPWITASASSIQFSHSVVSDSLRPHESQHTRLPVHHYFPEFTQTHVHWICDAIQPSHPWSSPSPPAPNPSQHQSLFQWVNSSHEVAKVLEFQL